MNPVKISVIVPTYKRDKLLRETLKGLLNQVFSGYEIIVVDNACSKETQDLAALMQKGIDTEKCSLKYVPEPRMGLHHARHMGAKAANGDILLYIDDDVIVDKNLLKEIEKPYADARVGAVGGKILPRWEAEPPPWIDEFPKHYLSILDDEEGPKEVELIYGCNYSIRRQVLFDFGGFNPDAFADKKMWRYRTDGETGILKKISAAGMKVIYNPRAVVWHFIPHERLTVKYFQERAFKSGIESSFLRFRYRDKSLNPMKLLARSAAFGMLSAAAAVTGLFSVRHRVKAYYYMSRCLYETRLATDKELRQFVRKKGWLE